MRSPSSDVPRVRDRGSRQYGHEALPLVRCFQGSLGVFHGLALRQLHVNRLPVQRPEVHAKVAGWLGSPEEELCRSRSSQVAQYDCPSDKGTTNDKLYLEILLAQSKVTYLFSRPSISTNHGGTQMSSPEEV